MNTPEVLKPHETKFKPGAWKDYTSEELRWWVSLFSKRASQRAEREKALSDLISARNYLEMFREYVVSMLTPALETQYCEHLGRLVLTTKKLGFKYNEVFGE